jgi:hypothetical protein
MCCCERGRCDQFLPIPVCFPSGRVFFFFFCFVAAQRSPTFFRNPNVTSQHHTTTHHTKFGNPPSGLPFFRQIQQTRPGWRLSLRRIQLAVSHNPFRNKISRSRLAGPSTAFTKRTASRLVQYIAWGTFAAPLPAGTCFHGVGAAREAPPTTPSGGCGRTPQFPQQRGFRVHLGCRFSLVLFSFCHMFLSCCLFSSWMFLPAYTPFVVVVVAVVVYCVVSNHNYVLACTVETTGRKDGIGSTSSGLGRH